MKGGVRGEVEGFGDVEGGEEGLGREGGRRCKQSSQH